MVVILFVSYLMPGVSPCSQHVENWHVWRQRSLYAPPSLCQHPLPRVADSAAGCKRNCNVLTIYIWIVRIKKSWYDLYDLRCDLGPG